MIRNPTFATRLTLGLAIAATVSLTLGSCTTVPSKTSEPVVPADIRALRRIAMDYSQLSVAARVVDQECLLKGGLKIAPENYPLYVPAGGISGLRAVFNSEAQAKAQGYGPLLQPLEADESLGETMNRLYLRLEYGGDKTPVRYRAPSGVGLATTSGGCFGEAKIAVYGSVLAYLQWISVRSVLGAQTPIRADQIATPLAIYARCMKSHGIQTAGPSQTLALAKDKFSASRSRSAAARPPERHFAVIDANYQIAAHLRSTADAAWISNNMQWIARNRTWIQSTEQVLTDGLLRAQQILKGAKTLADKAPPGAAQMVGTDSCSFKYS